MIFKKIKIGIINMDCNNMYSIFNTLKKIGYKTSIINKNKSIKNFDLVVLPGVGSYKQAMNSLKKKNIDYELLNFLEYKNRGLMGICLGMQLLFQSSEEFGKNSGLGLIEGNVKKFKKKLSKVPHIGWNKVEFRKKNPIYSNLNKKNFYFVHSFYCRPKNEKIILSKTNYNGKKFCSSILSKNIIAVQFHPEKSGKVGVKFLQNIHHIL